MGKQPMERRFITQQRYILTLTNAITFLPLCMFQEYIARWLEEDLGSGDVSSQATMHPKAIGQAQLLVKSQGIIAGIQVAKEILHYTDPFAEFVALFNDGDAVNVGDVAFKIKGNAINLLSVERLLLNCMQRMSGIATKTHLLQSKIAHTKAKLLDTRKTTPGFRMLEKQAVLIGGGLNHRFGLYDMMMLKDNHIDFCGGITLAVAKALAYKKEHNLKVKLEVEVRTLSELNEVIQLPSVDRIMLDNFTPQAIKDCIQTIPKHFEIEASGGIHEHNIVAYAETGVDFVSVGALTHNVQSLDLSLKAMVQPE